MQIKSIILTVLLIISCATLSCQREKSTASAQAKRFDLRGKVVSFDKAKKEITVAHDEVKDYMPAMTMPFPVKEKDEWVLDVVAPGSNVGATLVVDSNGFWLENVVVSSGGNDTISRGSKEPPPDKSLGKEVPDFELVNQDGKRIKVHGYRGKALLLTFIYTRCPLPEYCTLMSNNFASLNKSLYADQSLRDRTHLLSITIDPAYDTPKVLKSYGAAHTGEYTQEKFERWEFATGKPDDIKQIANFFGLSYFEEKQQITHSLRTALIAPDGKVYKTYPGNEWSPKDVLADVQKLFSATTN
jgi:protein SCO1/2